MSADVFLALGAAGLEHERAMLVESRRILEHGGEEAANHLPVNAGWVNRSGDARSGLAVEVTHPDALLDGGEITLVQRTDYGVYLEDLLPDGSPKKVPLGLGALQPTVDEDAPTIFAALEAFWHA